MSFVPRNRASSLPTDLIDRQRVVADLITSNSAFSAESVEEACEFFFVELGLPRQYWESNSDSQVAHHIASLQASKELARASGRRFFDVQLSAEGSASAFFATRSTIQTEQKTGAAVRHGDSTASPTILLERYIEAKYLSQGENTASTTDLRSFTQAVGTVSLSQSVGSTAGSASVGVAATAAAVAAAVPASPMVTSFVNALTAPLGAVPDPATAATAHSSIAPSEQLPFRLQCYRSKGVLEDGAHLRLYFLRAARFPPGAAAAAAASGTGSGRIPNLADVADTACLTSNEPPVLAVFQTVLDEQANPSRLAPSVHIVRIRDVSAGEDMDVTGLHAGEEVDAAQLVVGFKSGSAHSLFSGLSSVYRWFGLYAVQKAVEPLACGVTIFSFRLRSLDLARAAAAAAAESVTGTPRPSAFGSSGAGSLGDELDDEDSSGGGILRGDSMRIMHSTSERESSSAMQQQRRRHQGGGGSSSDGTTTTAAAELLRIAAASHARALSSLPPQSLGGGVSSCSDLAALTLRSETYARGGSAGAPSLADRLDDLARDVRLHFLLPRTSVTPLLSQGILSSQECCYAYAAWKFTFHFLPRMSLEINTLSGLLRGEAVKGALGPRLQEALSIVSRLRKAVQVYSFTESQILDCIYRHPEVVAWAYADFAARLRPAHGTAPGRPGSPSSAAEPVAFEAGVAYLRKALKNDDDITIFSSLLTFNASVLKTNFYRKNVSGLAFRLNPSSFLSSDYADSKPFGIFMVITAECRGFHTRFADVARGGVRLIKSASPQAYAANVASCFDECFNLAATQQLKNKDIPEGGSKGVILLSLAHQDKTLVAFRKYVDALLDVLLTPCPEVVDLYGKEELLFLGPDEGTAELMDWSCAHARARGYRYWKAFTTGKGFHFGGVPHDKFAMTTRGVRAYVTGIQHKMGLDGWLATTKAITGGPDGDLGSNEIKLANEKIVAVVDGSGVLADADGIDREELLRLAEGRLAVAAFSRAKLGKRGYLVLVDETDVRLPDGTLVPAGLAFRNSYHLWAASSAQFFVPCGGRPAAVNADNVEQFLYGMAVPGVTASSTASAPGGGAGALPPVPRQLRFKYIVEGANLFFTNDARLRIEAAGVPLFKDSSANKGGVTSSSLEVLAALALTDAEFAANMCISPAQAAAAPTHGLPDCLPEFYKRYVEEVQAIIDANATLEFECLWREHARAGTPFTLLSDALSSKIDKLSTKVADSDSLWDNAPLRRLILRGGLPASLVQLVGGFDVVVSRLPGAYLRALYGSRLASRFVYEVGLSTTEFSFYEYLDALLRGGGEGGSGGATSAASTRL